jgi:uncharacterized linocin/CFP29 family protein
VITGPGSAPIAPAVWAALEADVREALTQHLVGRKVVDFDGPHGLDRAALNLGSLEHRDVGEAIDAGLRAVLPLLEVRVPFDLSRAALDARERGAPQLSDEPALAAARRLADLENRAIFYGLAAAGIHGLLAASSQPRIPIGNDARSALDGVARALLALHEAAVDGPYAVVLGDEAYRRLAASPEYPPLKQLRELVGGNVLHSHGLEGGLVISLRGGDLTLCVGQDATIGYAQHDREHVSLYLLESFTFLVSSPEVIVALEGS